MELGKIRLNKFKIELQTTESEYSFCCKFEGGLNVIRGDNSSGKSTLINSIIYSIGMEELIGGQGTKSLPYTLKDHVVSPSGEKISIVSSFVYLEITNFEGESIVLKRSVKSEAKNPKLIEVIQGPYLSEPNDSYSVEPTYIHDKGSAQNATSGFFRYMEEFINVHLPIVSSSTGGETKLYLQCIFSALIIEQKRGWTDYLANIPYFAIRESKLKVIQFILNMDVFDNERRRDILLSEIADISKKWTEEFSLLKLVSESEELIVKGVPSKPDSSFDKKLTTIFKHYKGEDVKLAGYHSSLISLLDELDRKSTSQEPQSDEQLQRYKESKSKLLDTIAMSDRVSSELRLCTSRLAEHKENLSVIAEDLEKNKIALKLKNFGAEKALDIAKDQCPSCHQPIDDSLLLPDTLFYPMTIEENISYLEKQKKMVSRYIVGLEHQIQELSTQLNSTEREVVDQKSMLFSIKRDLRSSDSIQESDIRLKIQAEEALVKSREASERIDQSLNVLVQLKEELKNRQARLRSIPRSLSQSDFDKIQFFEKEFRSLAKIFGYRSAATEDIEINKGTLFPYLSGIELREVQSSKEEEVKADIKSDSSASDFVRLIWSYLLSLYRTSQAKGGNHLGLLVLDEPAQHSMAVEHVNALLTSVSKEANLQTIVAASFDQRDDIFRECVGDINYHLIRLPTKLLQPTNHR
nr:hypothetical protein [uncultured Halomonas sp.]